MDGAAVKADRETAEADRGAVAVTVGDPRGIGPEVVEAALRRVAPTLPDLRGVVLGPEGDGLDLPESMVYEAVGTFDGTEVSAGRVAAEALRRAAALALDGEVGAMITGPVHKPALHAAGWRHPGQTEMLQALAEAPVVGMLMCAEETRLGGALRVLLATTHIPLREVPARLTADLLVEQIRLLERELRAAWGLERPRIALCALNPHASDRGLFGDEEERIYAPALARLEEGGAVVSGPVPADTVFSRALEGEFDAVVSPYHDVGMAAFKTASFGAGVNVTLGLPFVRTSPDHGTAFDIVGTGRADPGSMEAALILAERLRSTRFDTSPGAI